MGRTDTPAVRARIGLGTLVVFVSMVIVAAIAAGVLINTVDFRAGGTDPAESDGDTAPAGVLVIAQTGQVDADGRVQTVNLTVTVGPDQEPIDLRDATVSWVGPRGAYHLAHASAAGGDGDGSFTVTPTTDPSGAESVLDEPGDRMVLTFDLGADAVPGAAEFGEPLAPGDMARVTITTGDGTNTVTRLAVPRSHGSHGRVFL